jgi:hypothetical protein
MSRPMQECVWRMQGRPGLTLARTVGCGCARNSVVVFTSQLVAVVFGGTAASSYPAASIRSSYHRT